MKTSIEWCDHSINPLRARHNATGNVGHYCEKIASGCKHCYSSRMQLRFKTPEFGGGQLRDDYELFLDDKKLQEVSRRRIPTRYFWCDMTDIFGAWVQPEWLSACFATMDATPHHTHLLLTKRPENVRKMWCSHANTDGRPPSKLHRRNVNLIYSASDQATLDAGGMPDLLACRDLCPVLGLSLEPLVGPVPNLFRWLNNHDLNERGEPVCSECGTTTHRSYAHHPTSCWECGGKIKHGPRIDWVIVGGESGPHARPMHPDWVRSIRDQCIAAGVPFFFKQWGEWAPFHTHDYYPESKPLVCMKATGETSWVSGDVSDGVLTNYSTNYEDSDISIERVGKAAAGRLLDGREWNQYPTAPAEVAT